MGSAFAVDYFNPSFRTPDEVIRYLDVPVLASLPMNGNGSGFVMVGGHIAGSLKPRRSGSNGNRIVRMEDENAD